MKENTVNPKVYDKEDHEKFKAWYFAKTHKVLTPLEMESTRKNFTYDMAYYLTLQNPSKNYEIL